MTNPIPRLSVLVLQQWREKIVTANRNNIYCHCQACGAEWVDSGETLVCETCGSDRLERIACWQFPDD